MGRGFYTEADQNDEESIELDNSTNILGLKKAENTNQDQKEVYTFKPRNYRFKRRELDKFYNPNTMCNFHIQYVEQTTEE